MTPIDEEIDPPAPEVAAARLARLGGLAFLDSAMRHETLGRYSYVTAAPFAAFTVDAEGALFDGKRMEEPPLVALDKTLQRFSCETIPGLPPFQCGAIGVVAYEFAHHLERLAKPADFDPSEPSLRLNLYDTVLAYDHRENRAFLVATGHPAKANQREAYAKARIAEFKAALAIPVDQLRSQHGAGKQTVHNGLDWHSNVFAADYRAAIERVRDYILDGDIYQANIAQTFTADLPADFDSFALYLRLRQTNAAPFGAYLDCGDLVVASSSPERFLKRQGDRIETRPIKGTARRSRDEAEDKALGEALLTSEKDRAENVMIVDLLRNDISRICTADSVEVPVLCGLETYAAVHHLVSVVTGRLKPGICAGDLLSATFPGGSITGAPKIRAMDIITEIEKTVRGPYCGSIGSFGFDGSVDLNIAIRTVSFQNGRARLAAGGGITVLSDPAAEYEETFIKATRVFAAFEPDEAKDDAVNDASGPTADPNARRKPRR